MSDQAFLHVAWGVAKGNYWDKCLLKPIYSLGWRGGGNSKNQPHPKNYACWLRILINICSMICTHLHCSEITYNNIIQISYNFYVPWWILTRTHLHCNAVLKLHIILSFRFHTYKKRGYVGNPPPPQKTYKMYHHHRFRRWWWWQWLGLSVY